MSVIFKSSEETVLKTDMILVTEIGAFPVSLAQQTWITLLKKYMVVLPGISMMDGSLFSDFLSTTASEVLPITVLALPISFSSVCVTSSNPAPQKDQSKVHCTHLNWQNILNILVHTSFHKKNSLPIRFLYTASLLVYQFSLLCIWSPGICTSRPHHIRGFCELYFCHDIAHCRFVSTVIRKKLWPR